MNSSISETTSQRAADKDGVTRLYLQWLDAWNERDAGRLAALCTEECSMIGFDGSMYSGSAQVEKEIAQIFAHHPTAAYIANIKEVRFPAAEVAVLRAVAGMVPPGKSDINPEVNAIQTLVAVKRGGDWRLDVFQNTPAAFHGRPELGRQLMEELREILRTSPPATSKKEKP